MWINKDLDCCGLAELCGIQRLSNNYKKTKQELINTFIDLYDSLGAESLHGCKQSLIIFTCIDKEAKQAQHLKKIIAKNKWGQVVKTSRATTNGNTGNRLFGYLWAPNTRFHRAITKNYTEKFGNETWKIW